jgi:orotidine-5'-phosphate decarboxylase
VTHFSDRLIAAIRQKNAPCVVGLDPRLEGMPRFILHGHADDNSSDNALRCKIATFHRVVIDSVFDLVPAVKPQTAFFEQYGIPGLLALADTIEYAQEKGLLVIVDGKRNDIGSTAEAYARAFLGGGSSTLIGDALTVSPYLGRDSLMPFIEACEKYGKGIFVLVKTSNKGSGDLQDRVIRSSGPETTVFMKVAELVAELGEALVGISGYSSIGAVVGATYPEQAAQIRAAMPKTIFLVPGYGSQGGTGKDVVPAFHPNGMGAIVNASRSITYELPTLEISEPDFRALVRMRAQKMVAEINGCLVSTTVQI